MDFGFVINEMETLVLNVLTDHFRTGLCYRKQFLKEKTGIPLDFLTVILRRLKLKGLVRLEITFNEENGLPSGCGYVLTYNPNKIT